MIGPGCKIKCNAQIPEQQKTSIGFMRSTDCYQQRFLKFPLLGVFHSYSELLHAALLEANTNVSSFVPQPFKFLIGRRRYIPDCFYLASGKRIVVEIKPQGKLSDEIKIPLTEYLAFNDILFKVISNEEILEQETLALNWLYIVRTLLTSQYEETSVQEIQLYEKILAHSELSVGDIIDLGNRIQNRQNEIALFQLVYKGKLELDLTEYLISTSTLVKIK